MRPGWSGMLVAYVVYALLATVVLAWTVPPYQNPDERNHLLRAEQVSRWGLVGQRFDAGRNSGGLVAPEIEATASVFQPVVAHREQKVTAAMFAAVRRVGWRGAPIWASFANTSIYPPFFYAPAVVGIWAGKLGHVSVVHTLVLARVLTGLVCCALIGGAIARCLRDGMAGAGLLIFAVATLPMSLSVASACSQDGVMLGAGAVAAAGLVRLRRRAGIGVFVAMCVCLGLMAMARPAYVALGLVPLAAGSMTRRARWAGAVLVVLACLGWVAVAGSYAAIDTTASHGADVGAQLLGLLDPAHDLALALGTGRRFGDYVEGFVGKLGWLDVDLPRSLIVAACVMLVGTGVVGWRGRPAGAWVALGVAISVGLVFLVQYLTWTAVGKTVVDGVQGRYFLPLAMVLSGIAGGWPRHRLGRGLSALVVVFPVVAIGVTIRALIVRYYLGAG
ncbi:MAG: DUF2142 domain-containing protein [Acetobacteraceae bacterium]